MLKKTTFILWASLSVNSHASSDSEKLDIITLMTEKELTSSGVNSLTETQIESLNRWLVRYTAKDSGTIRNTNKEVIKISKEAEKTRIAGEFKGWSGKTIFRLENGQIWQQRFGGQWKTSIQNPVVLIRKNFVGAYKLEIESANKSIGVKRIR